MSKIKFIFRFIKLELVYSRKLLSSGKGIFDKIKIFFELIRYYLHALFSGKNNSYQHKKLIFKINVKNKDMKSVRFYHQLLFSSNAADSKAFTNLILKGNYNNLLDLGLNVGRISLNFLDYNKNSQNAYGIDASFSNIKLVNRFLKKNSLHKGRFKVKNVGVSNKKDKLNFYYINEFSGTNSFTKANNHMSKKIKTKKVNVDRIDNILKGEKVIFDLVKIDLEGFEFNALKGMKNYLIKNKPDILIEIRKHDNHLNEIKDLFSSYGLKSKFKKIDNYDNYLITFS